MNLAAILGVFLTGTGCPSPAQSSAVDVSIPYAFSLRSASAIETTPQTQDKSQSAQGSPAQNSQPASSSAATSDQGPKQNAPNPAKPFPPKTRQHKKPLASNCPPASTSPNSANGTRVESTQASADAGSAKPNPCPSKKVVQDGGSDEPTIQLIGGTNPAKPTSTEQVTSETEENLKKIAARTLSPSQQEMVNQIKQFMEQSKAAVADGDRERGHNLAMKARLLSDELVKP